MNYADFLTGKVRSREKTGFDPAGDLSKLFPWQKEITAWACKSGCAALFEDCGLGKTPQQLHWAREVHEKTGDPVLILAPLAVSQQTVREGGKFGIEVNLAETDADIVKGINITNYEKLDKFDTSRFAGVVLDESSILKAYTGKVKRQIVEAFRGTPYRLCATATPAPNDLMELLNHAEFLGVMKSNEALSCWFIADQSNSGHYRLKGHAEKDFWQWVASWAVCIGKPSDIGHSDEGYELPPLTEHDVILPTGAANSFEDVAEKVVMSATGFHTEKRRTLELRARKCAELANGTDSQVLVWCYQNDEADALKKLIPDAVEVRGSDRTETKERAALDFAEGRKRVLISKPSIFGYGLNFQNCDTAVFCGMDYSYESYYQAVRRLYRFGQERPVNIYRVLGDAERHILEVVDEKAQMKADMGRSMAEAMREFQTEAVRGRAFTLDLTPQTAAMPSWLKEVTA